MTSHHRPARPDGDAETCPPPFRLPNGEPLRPAATAVPKMGVRARIADWPPKRDGVAKETGAAACRDAAAAKCCRASASAPQPSGFKALHRLARRRCSKDAEFPDGWVAAKAAAAAPLRHRSSSEVTLSECDGEEVAEPRSGGAGANLFREYGSTSSIDAQGISEQSFFEMLNEFRSKKSDRQNGGAEEAVTPGAKTDGRCDAKEKPRRRCPKSDADSIFKKLRSTRTDGGGSGGEADEPRLPEPGKVWLCQKSFAHYDVQSMLFDLNAVALNRAVVAQRRNTTTGASAASAAAATQQQRGGGIGAPPDAAACGNAKEDLEHDAGDDNSNELLLSCPHFRNELGGAGGERDVAFARASPGPGGGGGDPAGGFTDPPLAWRPTNAGVSVLEVPKELQRDPERLKHYSVEHVDLGARYYRDYFHGKEHSNYFGVDDKLGPVAVSIKREKLEDHKEHGPQYQYRIIFRTSELITLRGSILEDATPTATKAGTGRGLPVKDALEYVVPELNLHCLRLALSTPKVPEQLLKLDEQNLCRRHKIGILYCKAGQSSEEEMYNNEDAGPAFEEFLALLGEKVCLKAFPKYAAQLDTKTDSTGTHSLYTTYQDYEIMFHVSTMLPYTPNNRQQLLRKRHIGNDIVTIIFQEPGALPFTPQNVRSHFQHVFIIVRAHQPCTDNVSYSVAVTRSKDVPPFGPPVPAGASFRKSPLFRHFLLAKALNAEHAAHKSDKFHAMATRTRQEYLRDLAENYVTNTPVDSAGKFNLISLASKKKEKAKARAGAERRSAGALAWRVAARDFARGGAAELPCVLGVSNEFVVLLDAAAKEVVFNCFCGDVIGWTAEGDALKVFYGRGDHVALRALHGGADDVREIVQRLKVMTDGCDTVDMTLRRNGLGQLGFHVKYDGTVAEVEDYGFAWQAGLRQGSRLVEICKVAVVTLTHDQMIDLLRTSVTVKVVIVPPRDDGAPRRAWADTLEPPPAPAGDAAAAAAYRSCRPGAGARQKTVAPAQGRAGKAAAAAAYREAPALHHGKRPVSFPETPHPSSSSSSPAGTERPQPYRQPSGSFSAPAGAAAAYARYKPSPERYAASPRPPPPLEPPDGPSSGDSSSGGFSSHESTMERHKPEPLWHVPAQSRLPAGKRASGKDSPNRHSKGDAPYSSHSSSTTLSSTASSDERWFETPEPAAENRDADAAKLPRQKEKSPKTPAGEKKRDPSPPGGASYPGYEAPRPPPLSASVPKSFFSKQPPRSKPGWKRLDEPPEPKKPSDAGAKNVFGQPRLRASLRDLRSPRRSHKSTIEDDLKKLLLMDVAAPEPESSAALQRTLSDESLCGGRRDGAFGADAFPSSTLPGRRQHPNGSLPEKKSALSASELALAPPSVRRAEPPMMPLPDTAAGLEWASLVSAAKAYEVQRAVSLFSLAEPEPGDRQRGLPALSPPPPPPPPAAAAPPALDLPGKVSQLEAMLKQLHSDLQKEKQDKVVLQAEVATLRQNNRRLQEESHSAARQLRRFARIFGAEREQL